MRPPSIEEQRPAGRGDPICIVMVAHPGGSNWQIAADRFFEVSPGILVALGVAALVLPQRARRPVYVVVATPDDASPEKRPKAI